MLTLIVVLTIVIGALLILVVLIQNSKGGGISSGFGGSNMSQFMGVKKTGDLLERTTWVLATLLVVLSLSANSIYSSNAKANQGSGSVLNEQLNKNANAQQKATPDAPQDSATLPADTGK